MKSPQVKSESRTTIKILAVIWYFVGAAMIWSGLHLLSQRDVAAENDIEDCSMYGYEPETKG